jgi:mannose-1-phosphate guanylyltransferase
MLPSQHEAITKAAILCGGEGKRLRPLTQYFQKTMIPIGPKMRPLLEFVVRLMVYYGVPDLILLSGYQAERIEGYFGDGARFGANIMYSKDPEDSSGSAQALMHAITDGKVGRFDDLIVYYGDVLSALDVGAVLSKHRSAHADVTLVLSKNYAVPVGVAEVRGDRVVKFREKPNLGLDVTMGCLVVSSSCVAVLKEVTSEGESKDIMTHFVPRVIERRMNVTPFFMEGFWHDLGSQEAFDRLDLKEVEKSLGFLDHLAGLRSDTGHLPKTMRGMKNTSSE